MAHKLLESLDEWKSEHHEKMKTIDDIIKKVPVFCPANSGGLIGIRKPKTMDGKSLDITRERLNKLKDILPDAFRVLQSPTTATLVPCKEESVGFDDTENIFIEGENLEVLKVLQKSYFGKIKMIYIDPPYNTGNDKFIYPDKFSETRDEYLNRIGDRDETGYMTREGLCD